MELICQILVSAPLTTRTVISRGLGEIKKTIQEPCQKGMLSIFLSCLETFVQSWETVVKKRIKMEDGK